MKSNRIDGWFARRVKVQMAMTGVTYDTLLFASSKSWREWVKDPRKMKLENLVYLLNRLGFPKDEQRYILSLLLEDIGGNEDET